MYRFQQEESVGGKVLSGLYYGVAIALVLCIVWWVWASLFYRYSNERIGSLGLIKYQLDPKAKKLNESEFYQTDNVAVNYDKTMAGMDIVIKDKLTNKVLYTENRQFKISDSCLLTDLTCIQA